MTPAGTPGELPTIVNSLPFMDLAYWYTWQVSILGLGPIWMTENENLKQRAAKLLKEWRGVCLWSVRKGPWSRYLFYRDVAYALRKMAHIGQMVQSIISVMEISPRWYPPLEKWLILVTMCFLWPIICTINTTV